MEDNDEEYYFHCSKCGKGLKKDDFNHLGDPWDKGCKTWCNKCFKEIKIWLESKKCQEEKIKQINKAKMEEKEKLQKREEKINKIKIKHNILDNF